MCDGDAKVDSEWLFSERRRGSPSWPGNGMRMIIHQPGIVGEIQGNPAPKNYLSMGVLHLNNHTLLFLNTSGHPITTQQRRHCSWLSHMIRKSLRPYLIQATTSTTWNIEVSGTYWTFHFAYLVVRCVMVWITFAILTNQQIV